jgi:photosystem II stability/assembly factor-like uncharacterized protein
VIVVALLALSSLGVGSAGASIPSQNWTLSNNNADSSSISCPSTTTCYGVGSSVVTTTDAGSSWKGYTIPSSAQGLTGISCPSVSTCFVIGYDLYELSGTPMPEYEETGVAYQVSFSSSGPTWTAENLPVPTGDLSMPTFSAISCPALGTCYITSEFNETASQEAFYGTTDGGTDWSTEPIPSGISETRALTCPTTASDSTCYTIDGDDPATFGVTTDGGSSWTLVASPSPTGGLTSITCPSASTCLASTFAQVLSTTDGGSTWVTQTVRPAKKANAVLEGMSCPSVQDCDVVGVVNTNLGFVAVTDDGGTTWKSVPMPTESQAFAFLQATCPAVNECFAIAGGGNVSYILSTIPVQIATTSLPPATRNTSYSVQLQASGGLQPYHWKKLSALPKGLSLSSDGVVSGTPKSTDAPGTYSISVSVKDAEKGPQTASTTLSLTLS